MYSFRGDHLIEAEDMRKGLIGEFWMGVANPALTYMSFEQEAKRSEQRHHHLEGPIGPLSEMMKSMRLF